MPNILASKPASFVISLLFISSCSDQREALFQNVHSNQKWSETSRLTRNFNIEQSIPKYIIVHNEMYLNVQNTRHRMFYTEVEHPTWNQAVIAAMKSSDTIFSTHLPHRDEPSGGIGWLPTITH
jgi:hypothetical protein